MNSQTIVMCVVAFLIGMLLAHMLKDVCGCNKVVEGAAAPRLPAGYWLPPVQPSVEKQAKMFPFDPPPACGHGTLGGEMGPSCIDSIGRVVYLPDPRDSLHDDIM